MKEYINMVLSNSLRPKASQTYIDAYKEYKDSGGEQKLIDLYTFPFGLGIGLLFGFLLAYVLLIKMLSDLKRFQAETSRMMNNVKDYLENKEVKKQIWRIDIYE